MGRAVATTYGWDDLTLGHAFHGTAQGTYYSLSEAARREVLGADGAEPRAAYGG